MSILMKRLLALCLAVLMLSSVAALAEDDMLARIQKRGSIVIAMEGNWEPWTYHNENDELVGLDVEIGKLIAEGLGVKPEFVVTDWDSIFGGIDSGRFDIACNGVGITEKRQEKYTFSEPYVYTHKVLVVRQDNDKIHTIDDLEGVRAANSATSTYAAICEQHGAIMTYVESLPETITLLVQGRIDATVNAEVSILNYMKKHPEAPIKIAQVLPETDPVGYPVLKGPDTDSLIEAINGILEAARQDGRLADICLRNFGVDNTKPE